LYRSKCIGCGSCAAVCPEYFEMDDDGLSRVKNAKRNESGEDILEIGEDKIGYVKEAAEVCPVQIIEIV